MSKGITPKIKKTTLTKDAKINKFKQIPKKDLKQKERHDTWTRRIEDATKEKVKKEKLAQSQPLSFLDTLTEQLDSIETKSQPTPVRLDLINPHLKRVVSNRGRKQTLKKEEDQFRKVMSHPAFKSNPLGTIGMHLNNTMKQINTLPTKKE